MDSDHSPESPLPTVGDEFRSRSGLEHAAEAVRKVSVGALAALVEALSQEVLAETKNVLGANESSLATARGRLQKAVEIHDRVKLFERTLMERENRQQRAARHQTLKNL